MQANFLKVSLDVSCPFPVPSRDIHPSNDFGAVPEFLDLDCFHACFSSTRAFPALDEQVTRPSGMSNCCRHLRGATVASKNEFNNNCYRGFRATHIAPH